MSCGAELTGTLWGTIGSLLSVSCVDLLGVKSDVTTLNADHIIPHMRQMVLAHVLIQGWIVDPYKH